MKVCYIDVDNIHYEGQRSGATAVSCEMLAKFNKKNDSKEILALYNKEDSNKDRNSKKENFYNELKGIKVLNLKLELNEVENILKLKHYDTIFFSLPSVFFSKKDYELIELIINNAQVTIVFIADTLYPKQEHMEPSMFNKYISLLKKCIILSNSKFMYNHIKQHLNLESYMLYPSINYKKIKIENMKEKKYITLINPVRVKGIDLFEKIAEIMPDCSFLIVKGWGETESYITNLNNVKVMEYQTDINKIWNITKIYLGLSIWEEGYGRVISEALLSKTVLIANNIGGIKESSLGKGILINPVYNYGEEIYPKFNEEELLDKANEIADLIRKNYNCEEKALNLNRKEMIKFLKRNDKQINKFIIMIRKEVNEKNKVRNRYR